MNWSLNSGGTVFLDPACPSAAVDLLTLQLFKLATHRTATMLLAAQGNLGQRYGKTLPEAGYNYSGLPTSGPPTAQTRKAHLHAYGRNGPRHRRGPPKATSSGLVLQWRTVSPTPRCRAATGSIRRGATRSWCACPSLLIVTADVISITQHPVFRVEPEGRIRRGAGRAHRHPRRVQVDAHGLGRGWDDGLATAALLARPV